MKKFCNCVNCGEPVYTDICEARLGMGEAELHLQRLESENKKLRQIIQDFMSVALNVDLKYCDDLVMNVPNSWIDPAIQKEAVK